MNEVKLILLINSLLKSGAIFRKSMALILSHKLNVIFKNPEILLLWKIQISIV